MSDQVYWENDSCRICGNDRLVDFLNLGHAALTGRFPGLNEPDPPSAPLVLTRCGECGLIQNRHTTEPSQLYTYDYGYRSGTNDTMRRQLARIAAWVRERSQLTEGDLVVDVGCNDGTLLTSYDASGLVRIGIDPIAGKFAANYPPGIHTHEGYFNRESWRLAAPGAQAKAITSIAMFYDLEDPNDFVATISEALAADGIWVLEQSYLPSMLATNAFDTICHEHQEYYALEQIETLAHAHGLRVFDVETNDSNGGSFRLAVCHKDASFQTRGSVEELRASEAAWHLNSMEPYKAFAARITAICTKLTAFIDKEVTAGQTVYAYGASTKGNTLLHYCGLDHRRIIAAADRNPEKWGRRTPRTNIPIISENEARRACPDYFLVLPWHFREEFLEREAAFRQRGGKFIFPLPKFEIV